MSYTPEDQLLKPSLSKILEGMDEFDAAFKKRVEANESYNEWKQEHLEELGKISAKFQKMRVKLSKLKSETR